MNEKIDVYASREEFMRNFDDPDYDPNDPAR